MNSKIVSIILLLASLLVISSGNKLGLPVNYTWPLNTKNFCFAARFNLVLNINYTKTDGSYAVAAIPLDNNTFESYSVSCSAPANIHQLTIIMLNKFTALIFKFSVDDKNVSSLTYINGYITVDNQQSYITDYSNNTAGLHVFTGNETLFQVGRNYSYRCNTKTQITGFQTNSSLGVVSIDIENLRIQPFVDDSKAFNGYDDEKVCAADDEKNSNLIPIIVGACLATLVVVVLVGYLFGRRRNRNGYQSV